MRQCCHLLFTEAVNLQPVIQQLQENFPGGRVKKAVWHPSAVSSFSFFSSVSTSSEPFLKQQPTAKQLVSKCDDTYSGPEGSPIIDSSPPFNEPYTIPVAFLSQPFPPPLVLESSSTDSQPALRFPSYSQQTCLRDLIRDLLEATGFYTPSPSVFPLVLCISSLSRSGTQLHRPFRYLVGSSVSRSLQVRPKLGWEAAVS